jgi:nitrite reductase/ring-hydroxylating ferredoxin subunit
MSTWQDVGATEEFQDDEPRAVTVAGEPVAVVRTGGAFFAVHDICTHEVARLSEGFVEDGCIECPLHQGLFDLRTGAARKAPCVTPVRVYGTRVQAGRVEVQAP